MSHEHNIQDSDVHFTIDTSSREIVNHTGKVVLMQYDHNSERFTFELPRYIEGHDMSLCERVEIHYINTSAGTSSSVRTSNAGIYAITDLTVKPDDADKVVFSWLVSQNVTLLNGTIKFQIKFICSGPEFGTKDDFIWHSGVYSAFTVIEGINNSEVIVEEQADILNQWYERLFTADDSVIENIEQHGTEAYTNFENAVNNKAAKTLATIPEDYATMDAEIKRLKSEIITPERTSFLKPSGETITVQEYTNLANPASEEWLPKKRYNASSEIANATEDKAFVSNTFPCKKGDVLGIKAVSSATPETTSSVVFKFAGYDANNNRIGSAIALTESAHTPVKAGTSVTVDDNGVAYYEVLKVNGVYPYVNSDDLAYARISGLCTGEYADIIITINEEIVDKEKTVYTFMDEVSAENPQLKQNVATNTANIATNTEDIASLEEKVNSGLTWYALGDSITQGYEGYINDEGVATCRLQLSASFHWVKQLAAKKGYNLTNHGRGGTGYVRENVNSTDPNHMNAKKLVDTINFSECDIVTLAYGVNDWKYKANIGTAEDINSETVASMVSNMSYVIKKILRDNPSCKIYVLTPLNCASYGTYETNWGIKYSGDAANNLGLENIFELQKAVCEYFGIEYIDLTHSSIINRENLLTLLPDRIHPSVEAHGLLAREIGGKINYI